MFIIPARLYAGDEASKNLQPQVRNLGGNIYQIGGVKLDRNNRSASFSATVQMNDGLIEYLLVHHTGKTHESLFATAIEPFHLHTAMLLLGAKGSPESKGEVNASGQLNAAALSHAPALKGDNVIIFVKWKSGEVEKRVPVEEFVLNDKTKRNASRGPWTYNGSGFYGGGKFAAQVEGSVIALVTDPTALINNPRPGRDNDSIWLVDPAKTPAKDTPVEITIQLETARP